MRYILISGNMGSGKSTLTGKLAEHLGWTAEYESFEEAPYLDDYYINMRQWAFHNQLYFISKQAESHCSIQLQETNVVKDRGIYETVEVYVRNLFRLGYLAERDWTTFKELYQTLLHLLRPPDLVIYLRGTVGFLSSRVQHRNRHFERDIDVHYLTALNEMYDQWANEWNMSPLITVNIEQQDTLDNGFLGLLAREILAKPD